MSDEQERPLSRRELREREGWAAQDADAADVPRAEFDQALATESVPVTTTSSIPVIGPDGRIMSRRELRELWAAEEAAAKAAAEAETEAEPSVEAPEQSEHNAEAAAQADTESAALTGEEIDLDTAADADAEAIDDVATEHEPLPAPEHKGFRFPWSKKKDLDEDGEISDADSSTGAKAAATAAAGLGVAAATAAVSEVPDQQALAQTEPEVEQKPELEQKSESEPVAEPDQVAQPEQDAQPEQAAQPEPTPEVDAKTYSFPEVSPDPESRSIFDQHTTGTIGFVPTTEITDPSETGAFDDIITRAVADEGAASPTNTAALILPALPDTTDLSGALNETGEIVITGSIELPKTLGETGGHIKLHDTLDPHEAVVLGHDVHDVVLEAENHTQPVSATRAVSAQDSHNAIVSPVSKGDSKLPLILAISAGGLVVVVAAVFIWAASTGLFG